MSLLKKTFLALVSCFSLAYGISETQLLSTMATLEHQCFDLMVRVVVFELTCDYPAQDFQVIKAYFQKEFTAGLLSKLNSKQDLKKHKLTKNQLKIYSSRLAEMQKLAADHHKKASDTVAKTVIRNGQYKQFGQEFLSLGEQLGSSTLETLVTVVKLDKDKKAAQALLHKCYNQSKRTLVEQFNADRVSALAKQHNLGFINRWKFRSGLSSLETECSAFLESALSTDLFLQ
ncbi:hypothetical protein H0X48_05535 [Candidatus Dependentiae bacterium]|nr:hypothetical protein [Candidatus Dependentiae bacterium]